MKHKLIKREVEAHGEQESDVRAQDEREEDSNSMHEESHVSNRHMTWWQDAWWVRVNNGPHLRTARDRRKVWRAATRAAQEVRETGKVAGRDRNRRKGRQKGQKATRCTLCCTCNQQQIAFKVSSYATFSVVEPALV